VATSSFGNPFMTTIAAFSNTTESVRVSIEAYFVKIFPGTAKENNKNFLTVKQKVQILYQRPKN
jgi:hypothetical protein